MRWTRLFLAVLAVIVLFVGGGLAFLLTLDLNDYRGDIERFITSETGREFKIDGRLDLDLGRYTSLTVTGLRLGNPDWASQAEMFRVGRAFVMLDIRSLWSGPIRIDLVELDHAELHLVQKESGENNWTFGDDASGGNPAALFLRQALVADFALTFETPVLERPLQIQIDRLDQTQGRDGMFDAKLSGTINGSAVSLAGKYGPQESLLAESDLTIDVAGQFDRLTVAASGVIDDLGRPRQPRGKIDISAPDIDEITRVLGLPDLGNGDLKLNIIVEPGKAGSAISVAGNIGENDVESTGTVSDFSDFEHFSMRVSAQGPDLGRVTRVFGVANVPGGAYRFSGSADRNGPKLVLDKINLSIGEAQFHVDGQLPKFPAVNDAVLSLELHGRNLGRFTRLFGLPGVAEGPFDVTGGLTVASDGTEVVQLDVQTQIVALKATGKIGKGPGLVGTRVTLTGHDDDIAGIKSLLGMSVPATGPFAFDGEVEFGQHEVLLPEKMTITYGQNRLIATGQVGFDALANGTDLKIQADGPDLAELSRQVGIARDMPSNRYNVTGRLHITSDGYRIANLQARIGEARLNFDGLVSRAENFIGTRAKFKLAGPKLDRLINGGETLRIPDRPFSLSGEFELLADSVRLKGMQFKLVNATGTIDADIGLPLESEHGTFKLQASGNSFRAVLPGFRSWEPPDLPFEIKAKGRLDGGLLYLSPAAIRLGAANVTANGVFDMPPDATRTSLKLVAQAQDLSRLGKINGQLLPAADFNLDAGFSGKPQSYSITDLTIRTGASELAGSLDVNLDGEIPDVTLSLQSKLIDVTPFLKSKTEVLADIDNQGEQDKPKANDHERLIPDWKLPLEKLSKFNALIHIDIDRYRQNQWFIDAAQLDARVLDGGLVIERVGGRTAYGNATANLSIFPANESAKIHADFDGNKLVPGKMWAVADADFDKQPKYDIAFRLDGTGTSLREIAASLNGQVDLSSDGGQIPNSSLRFFYNDFIQELLTTLNPFVKTDPHTEISCIALAADIEDGLIRLNPGLVVQTSRINIGSTGLIDLHTEKIDINFKTAPRKKISISAAEFINPYLKVAGTLANPYLTLDPTNTIVIGGAAVVTAGLSLLAKPVWDRIVIASNPCEEIASQAAKKRKKKEAIGPVVHSRCKGPVESACVNCRK